jgi:hypothetical protein
MDQRAQDMAARILAQRAVRAAAGASARPSKRGRPAGNAADPIVVDDSAPPRKRVRVIIRPNSASRARGAPGIAAAVAAVAALSRGQVVPPRIQPMSAPQAHPAGPAPPVHAPRAGVHMASDVARLRATALTRLADNPSLTTKAAKRTAVLQNVTITPQEEDARETLRAGLRLASIIPAYALEQLLEGDLTTVPIDKAIEGVTDLVAAKHGAKHVWQCCSVWNQLTQYQDNLGIVHGERARASAVNGYLKSKDVSARGANPVAPAAPVARSKDAPPPERTRDGSSAATGCLSNLRSLAQEYFFDICTDKRKVRPPSAHAGGMSKHRQSAPEPSVEVMRKLQLTAGDKAKPAAVRNVAFICCLMAFGVLRACQAQFFGVLYFFELRGQTVLFGKTKKKVNGKELETFICPLQGVLGNEEWWSVSKDTLESLPGGFAGFACRDFLAPRGLSANPYHATGFTNNLMQDKKMDRAIQHVLEEDCGMRPEIAKRYTRHSFKRFQINISEAVDSKLAFRMNELELGRWAQSTLSRNPRAAPTDRARDEFLISATSVSRMYAANDTMTRLTEISVQQLERAQAAIESSQRDGNPLPLYGGWDRLQE